MIYRFSAICQNSRSFFAKVVIEKLILKFIWNLKGSQRVEIVMKKNKPRGLSLPDFKTYYRATVIKIMWSMINAHYYNNNKNVHVEQRNRIESQEINSYIVGQLIFHKGSKTI